MTPTDDTPPAPEDRTARGAGPTGAAPPGPVTGSVTGTALVDDVAARIRALIMSGEIAIGAQLRQAELAQTFGISRTPVREALRQLQTGGLIEVVPNRGAVVRVPVPWEVREAYEVRAELEGLAAERAVTRIAGAQLDELRAANARLREAGRTAVAAAATPGGPAAAGPGAVPGTSGANDTFHTLIHRVSGNARLARSINELNETFPRNVSALVLLDNPRHREEDLAEHDRIVDALAAGDAERARREMRSHVLGAGEQLATWYERRSSTVYRG